MNSHSCGRSYGYKHLTLTIKNQTDLKCMVVTLTKSMRRLRQRKLWKDNVKGGVFVVEITRKNSLWHAHLHVIIEAKYIVWKDLRDAWEAVSGSTGVFIQRIPASQIIRYVTKYVTKTELNAADQRVASDALKGSRLFQPFGSWHGPIAKIRLDRYVCPCCERDQWEYGTNDMYFKRCTDVDATPIPASVAAPRGQPRQTVMVDLLQCHALAVCA